MPELPDVAGFAAVAEEHATRHRVKDVLVEDASVLRGTSAAAFRSAITGQTFGRPDRHGKWLFVPVGPAPRKCFLAAHFGMTGSFEWCRPGAERHRHDRVIFVFAHGELRFRDMRKLKGLRLLDEAGRCRILDELGPDARTIPRAEFVRVLTGVRRGLKAALTDQAVIAGLGNLLADEILWRAHLDPRCRTDTLDRVELARLHAQMRRTLEASIRDRRVPGRPAWLTGHRQEHPGDCPRCGTPLEHTRSGGRSTVSCPQCQPGH